METITNSYETEQSPPVKPYYSPTLGQGFAVYVDGEMDQSYFKAEQAYYRRQAIESSLRSAKHVLAVCMRATVQHIQHDLFA